MFREELIIQYSFSSVRRDMITVGWTCSKMDRTRIEMRAFQVNYKAIETYGKVQKK
jgi:hypothetical protein